MFFVYFYTFLICTFLNKYFIFFYCFLTRFSFTDTDNLKENKGRKRTIIIALYNFFNHGDFNCQTFTRWDLSNSENEHLTDSLLQLNWDYISFYINFSSVSSGFDNMSHPHDNTCPQRWKVQDNCSRKLITIQEFVIKL